MNWTVYRNMTAKELIGRKAKTVREMHNGHGSIAAGTVVTITGKRSGLELETDKCEHCGTKIFIRKVEPGAVVLL